MVAFALVVAIGSLATPRQSLMPAPTWAGTWVEDLALSRALTEARGHEWRVAGAGAGGTSVEDVAPARTRTWKIQVTDTEMIVDDSIGSYTTRRRIRLDGTESVATTVISTDRFRTTRTQAELVERGTTFLELRGRDVQRDFTRTYTLNRRGQLEVETSAREAIAPAVTTVQVFVRSDFPPRPPS